MPGAVDAVAKALLPTLEELMARPSAQDLVFSAAFHAAYLDAVARVYSKGSCAPERVCRVPVRRALLEERSTWERVLLLKPEQVGGLRRYKQVLRAAEVLEIGRVARRVLCVREPCARTGLVFVLIADDNDQADTLLQRFFELDAMFSDLALEAPREKRRPNVN